MIIRQRILCIALIGMFSCSFALDKIVRDVSAAEARVAFLRRTIGNIPMADIPRIIQELDALTSAISPLKDKPTTLAKALKLDVQSSIGRVDAVVAAARQIQGDLSQRQLDVAEQRGQRVRDLRQERYRLTQDIRMINEQNQADRALLADRERQYRELEQAARGHSEVDRQLIQTLNARMAQLQGIIRAQEALQVPADASAAQIAALDEQVRQRQAANDLLADQLAQLEAEFQLARAQLAQAGVEKAALQEASTALQVERDAMRAQAESLQAELAAQHELLSQVRASAKVNQSQLDALNRQLDASSKKVVDLEARLAQAQKASASAAASSQELDAARQEAARLEAELARVSAEMSASHEALRQAVATSLREREQAGLAAAQAREALVVAQQQNERLSAQLAAEKASFDAQLATAQAAVGMSQDPQLLARLAALEKANASLAQQAEDLERQLNQNRAQYAEDAARLAQANSALEAQVRLIEAERSKLEADLAQIQAAAQAAPKQVPGSDDKGKGASASSSSMSSPSSGTEVAQDQPYNAGTLRNLYKEWKDASSEKILSQAEIDALKARYDKYVAAFPTQTRSEVLALPGWYRSQQGGARPVAGASSAAASSSSSSSSSAVDQALLQPDMQFGIDLNVLKTLYAHWQHLRELGDPSKSPAFAKKLYDSYIAKSTDKQSVGRAVESYFAADTAAKVKAYNAVFEAKKWDLQSLEDSLKSPQQVEKEAQAASAMAGVKKDVDIGLINRRLSMQGIRNFDAYLNDPDHLWSVDDPEEVFEILKPLLLDAAQKARSQEAVRLIQGIKLDNFDEETYRQVLKRIVVLIKP